MRRSPVHDWLVQDQPRWRDVDGAAWAWNVGDVDREQTFLRRAGLCDLSSLRKLGLRGPGAADWLLKQRVPAPPVVLATARLADGGWVARCGTNDYFLESGLEGTTIKSLEEALRDAPSGEDARVVRIEQQQATFLLTGERIPDLLAQTCAIDFRCVAAGELLMTRVAGANCMLLPESVGEAARYRLWVDFTFAASLWESLATICAELGGGPVGAGLVLSEPR